MHTWWCIQRVNTINFLLCSGVKIDIVIHNFMLTGAYEPQKAAKEHETEFHDNPNYVTVFVLRHADSHTNVTPATRRKKFATIEEEKVLKEDSANFVIAMCLSLVTRNFVHGFK